MCTHMWKRERLLITCDWLGVSWRRGYGDTAVATLVWVLGCIYTVASVSGKLLLEGPICLTWHLSIRGQDTWVTLSWHVYLSYTHNSVSHAALFPTHLRGCKTIFCFWKYEVFVRYATECFKCKNTLSQKNKSRNLRIWRKNKAN